MPPTSSYPTALRHRELPSKAFARIQETQSKLDKFRLILTDESRVVTPFGRAIDRGMSVSWRGRPTEAKAFRTGVDNYLDGLMGLVHLIEKSDAKLSGRSATIPVA